MPNSLPYADTLGVVAAENKDSMQVHISAKCTRALLLLSINRSRSTRPEQLKQLKLLYALPQWVVHHVRQ